MPGKALPLHSFQANADFQNGIYFQSKLRKVIDTLQEGRPLPGPERRLLSNTQK